MSREDISQGTYGSPGLGFLGIGRARMVYHGGVRPLPIAALLLTPSLISATSGGDAAIVIVRGAEDVKNTANGDGTTTTYVVRDPYPSEDTSTKIQEAMAARGWTLLYTAPDVIAERFLDGGARVRLRIQAEHIEFLSPFDVSQHFETQVWTDSGGNVVLYTMNRRCANAAQGLHSVYIRVAAEYRTAEQRKARNERMKAIALEEVRRQQEITDRAAKRLKVVSPTPNPTPCPTP